MPVQTAHDNRYTDIGEENNCSCLQILSLFSSENALKPDQTVLQWHAEFAQKAGTISCVGGKEGNRLEQDIDTHVIKNEQDLRMRNGVVL